MSRARKRTITAVLLLAVALTGAATAVVPPSSPRTWLLVATLLTAPGWSVVALRAPQRDNLAALMTVAASLTLSTLTSLGMLLAHAWQPLTALWILLLATALLLVLHLIRFSRGEPTL